MASEHHSVLKAIKPNDERSCGKGNYQMAWCESDLSNPMCFKERRDDSCE